MFMMRMFGSVVDVGMRISIGGVVQSARGGRRGNMTAIMAIMIARVRLGLRAGMVAQTVVRGGMADFGPLVSRRKGQKGRKVGRRLGS